MLRPVCGYSGAHYAHRPSPFRSAVDRTPSNHANSGQRRRDRLRERERLIDEIKLTAEGMEFEGEAGGNYIVSPMLITVLHDSKENGEREREEKMEMEFSLEWKVERESWRARSWRDELEVGDRCNRMLSRYRVSFYALDLARYGTVELVVFAQIGLAR